MRTKRHIQLSICVFLILVCFAIFGCNRMGPGDKGVTVRNCMDWPASENPADLGWDSSGFPSLEKMADKAGADAVMIVTGGRVVFAHGDIDKPMFIASVRKSILSALIGIAAAEGNVELDDTLAEFGINDDQPLTELELEATFRDLISARSGVYIETAAESSRMRDRRPIRGSHKPGTHWFYNNWDFNVAGELFERETSKSIFIAFDHYLAKPLCLQDFDAFEHTWYVYSESSPRFPAYHMSLSARDLAKIGQLYLQNGEWEGQQLVPRDWVVKSTSAISVTNEKPELASGYGYMWWVTKELPEGPLGDMFKGSFTAMGSGGQRMTVLPAVDTVILARANLLPMGIGASDFSDTSLWQQFIEKALALRNQVAARQ